MGGQNICDRDGLSGPELKRQAESDAREQDSKELGWSFSCGEVFQIRPSLYVVELRKSSGDPAIYGQICCLNPPSDNVLKCLLQLCKKLSSELGSSTSQQLLTTDYESPAPCA